MVECFAWVSLVSHMTDTLAVLVTDTGILTDRLVSDKFLSRVIGVEIHIGRVLAARTDRHCSYRKRIAPAQVRSWLARKRLPCLVELVRSWCIADLVRRNSQARRKRAAADKTGRKRALDRLAARHRRIWDFFVQPPVVNFAAARTRHF